MKLFIQSFGCQMNLADSQEMARTFMDRGFLPADGVEEADAVLVNTCTVRQHAEDRALSFIGRLREWKGQRPERFVVVAGCAAERTRDWLKSKFPFVDLVAGARSIEQFPQLLEEALGSRFNYFEESETSFPQGFPYGRSPVVAYTTVMRGCNYSCTYCIVPSIRGRELYRPLEVVVGEIREKVALGSREVLLLGQTVNSYRDSGKDFSDLLRRINGIADLERIRFVSPHPFYVNERMIAAMAECEKVCEHLHLPVQSGSDRILRLMRRNYNCESYLERVSALRERVPGIAITTDFIVGFPTETERDFQDTLRLARQASFTSAFCFKFSPRQGTPAATMDGQVDEGTKKERLAVLLQQVEEGTRSQLAAQVGKTTEVLFEERGFGRTRTKINLKAAGFLPGTLAQVEITGTTKTGLLGKTTSVRTHAGSIQDDGFVALG